jgi:cytosine/adenosine deaminase-related metal-dependent hydrolase
MILQGVEIVGSELGPSDVSISGSTIAKVEPASSRARDGIALDGALLFPGLVNSHDHLDFDIYPRLARRTYRDYVEWGADIQSRYKQMIRRIEAIPFELRVQWGVLKNLIAGVTSVAHHAPPLPGASRLPITCITGALFIHSVRLERGWRRRLIAPINREPYVFHIGEGTSRSARLEIDRLLAWNLLGRELIGVHAIALDQRHASRFRAIVWCPDSNATLFGATADVRSLKRSTSILFGTDSTLTADWSLWTQLGRARAIGALTDRELLEALTEGAARLWRLPHRGRIAPAFIADLVVAKKRAADRLEAFFQVSPEDILLVLREGRPVLVDDRVGCPRHGLYPIGVGGTRKWIALDAAAIAEQLLRSGVPLNLPIDVRAPST